MSAQTYTVFDLSTGRPVSCVTCRKEVLADHIRDGQVAIPGRLLDMLLNEVGDVQPNTAGIEAKRRAASRNARMASIEELERKQARRVRELLAESDPQLKAIEDQIAELRADL